METVVCGMGKCVFVEEYYGNRCKNCGVFYPHGQAPWDDYEQCGHPCEEFLEFGSCACSDETECE